MRPEELVQLLRRRPFVALRFHMTDGQTYDIRHPDQVLVTRSRADIGMSPDPVTGVLERTEFCSLLHIVRVKELHQSVTGNGG
jgi:hypothetical protein